MKRLMIWCLLFLTLLPVAASASAAEVTSTDLIEKAFALDGETVVYTGEAIGETLQRGDHAWVNLSDGANAIGVWVDTEMLSMISTVGRYGQVGDTLQVTGVFHRACREHGGELDIHAVQMTVVKAGYAVAWPTAGWMIFGACAFVAMDAVLLIVYLKRRSSRGKR
jgi:hypothetical protein